MEVAVRILLAADVYARGGIDGYFLELADAYRSAGHDVLIALQEGTDSAIPRGLVKLGIQFRFARMKEGLYPLAEIHEASRELLADTSPDALHVVCDCPWSGLGLRDVAADQQLESIVTEQLIGEPLDFSPADLQRVRSSYETAWRVIFVSEGNRRLMANAVGLGSVRSQVIPNGVDLARIRPYMRQSLAPRQPARVLAAARLAAEKSLDTLVEAAALLSPDVVQTVDIYGEGPQREALDQLISARGLDGRVFVHRWSRNVWEEMARHDVFVLSSRAEGMPYVVLEAMAVGIPIVASDVAGTVEALMDGSAGTITRQGDPDALADGIRSALSQPADTVRRAELARRRVESHHDSVELIQRTIALWN
jgi:glycosyltransferase involved in cell wall biosynthesis